jgi:single-strand DNA-binding protein
MKVFVEGRVQQRKYTGQDGIQRTAIDVIASDMEILTPKSQQSAAVPGSNDDFLSDDSLDLDEHPF